MSGFASLRLYHWATDTIGIYDNTFYLQTKDIVRKALRHSSTDRPLTGSLRHLLSANQQRINSSLFGLSRLFNSNGMCTVNEIQSSNIESYSQKNSQKPMHVACLITLR